jgi:glutaconate CoA-transferase subunit B
MTSVVEQATAPAPAFVSELLAVVSCRYLQGKRRVFAGIGLPTLAVALAQKSTSPDIEQVYESGVCGAHPPKLPETIADASLATGAEAILTRPVLFAMLQGGWIDVGFLARRRSIGTAA